PTASALRRLRRRGADLLRRRPPPGRADRAGAGGPVTYHIKTRQERFRGPIFSVLTDEVRMPDGRYADRDYVLHVGAVGVIAVDDEDRVVLVHQYRHAVGAFLWELPAGLVDVQDEPPAEAAARELAEEADLVARDWQLIVDAYTSPGYSNELIR